MDLEQKYTQEMIYEVEDYFMRKLQNDFQLDVSLKIAELINQTVHQIKPNSKVVEGHDDLKTALQEDIYTVDYYGGVIHTEKIPTFFELEVETLLTEDQPLVALIDIKEVECDRYLDLINKKKYLNESIKYNKTEDRRVIRSQS